MGTFFVKPRFWQRPELQSGDCTAELDPAPAPGEALQHGGNPLVETNLAAPAAEPTRLETIVADGATRPPALHQLEDDRLYTGKQIARVIGISHRTLERWRSERRGGPPYIKPDGATFKRGRVLYSGADVRAWLMNGRVAH